MTASPIGFVGLGVMGAPMAARLIEAGHALVLCDPREVALAPLLARGAEAAASPRALADRAETVLVALPDPKVARAVALGTDGLIHGRRIRTYVDFSTTGLTVAEEVGAALVAKGIDVLDCPMSGGERGARAGTLTFMVSGPGALVEKLAPVLSILGKKRFYLGERIGLGQAMKLVNNLVWAANNLAAAEALVMGAKAGLDAETMLAVINASSGRNSATEDKFPTFVLPRTFNDGSRTRVLHKDVTLALEAAEALGVPMWVGGTVRQFLAYAMSQGAADESPTALVRFIERWAGAEVKTRGKRS
ncbi:MAG: NAD(P)-dependent oxidoreductase [Proteobacteria bacterium]|nr:NAD(P)-dependent oxidoreductase [Pseudomonadota bacterium]